MIIISEEGDVMQQKRPRRLTVLITALCIVLLVTAVVIFGVLRYLGKWSGGDGPEAGRNSLQDYDRILPGVSICGVDVSGLTREDAATRVTATLQSGVDATVFTVQFPDRELEISGCLSRSIPTLDAAVAEAWQYGRDIVSQLDEAKRWTTEHPLALKPATEDRVQTEVIRNAVEQYAKTLDSRATDCRILEGEDTIEIIKGRDGRQLDVDTLCSAIEAAVGDGRSRLEAEYTLSISGERQLQALYEDFCTEAADACWDPETQAVKPEIRGRSFDLQQALEALNAPDGARIVIPVTHTEPKITEAVLQEKLFVDALGQYSSPHTAIAPRTNNLMKACESINGTVLNPGDVFSFNDIVGPRSYETGYQDAAIYLNGETTDSVGGGICQVASTIYVCALQANLEIVQRTEHMYFVTYVPEGQDATIYWDGGLDFQFRNSTDYPIRVDASVSNGYVHIALWGTNADGSYAVITHETLSVTPWEVVTKEDETQPPDYQKVTTTPYTGYVIRTYRNVYDKDGNLLSSEVEATSTYHKRDQVITVGKPPEPEDPVVDPADPPVDPEDPDLPGDIVTDPETPEIPPVDPFQPPEGGDPAAPEAPEESDPPYEDADGDGFLDPPWLVDAEP